MQTDRNRAAEFRRTIRARANEVYGEDGWDTVSVVVEHDDGSAEITTVRNPRRACVAAGAG